MARNNLLRKNYEERINGQFIKTLVSYFIEYAYIHSKAINNKDSREHVKEYAIGYIIILNSFVES